MGLPDLRSNNIQLYLCKTDIIHETVQQIMKDFAMFGVEITFSGNTEQAYNELHGQLIFQVGKLLANNSGLLMSVLYQVDISGREIEQAAHELPEYNQVEVVAHQIIFRELKKVLFRRYYRNH
ncbi:MAG: hypothetical protein RBS73_05585 [Prolixibacteraceae bacterium]|jgi:hypothetical protein|nr:hypothetical protein [Prolixibacteraceae bacterium]